MITAVAGGLVWATHSESAGSGLAPPQGNYSVKEAKAFTRFPLYYAGDSVNGYALTAVERDGGSAGAITFIYGDCTPPQAANGSYDGGCPPPVQVQVWSACDRNPSLYSGPASPTPRKTTVRGVPAAYYEDKTRLEIQTGTSTGRDLRPLPRVGCGCSARRQQRRPHRRRPATPRGWGHDR